MAKFYGPIAFAGEPVETKPGVYEEVLTVRNYMGDLLRNTRRMENGDKINNDISVGNSISIVSDDFADMNFHAIRYVKWRGAKWTVSEVEVQERRLILRLGEVYNGPSN